jgi:hypothetical protein
MKANDSFFNGRWEFGGNNNVGVYSTQTFLFGLVVETSRLGSIPIS